VSLNIHLYQSVFLNETRVFKITQSLAEASVFDRFLLLGTWDDGLAEEESIGHGRTVRRVRTRWFPPGRGGRVGRLLQLIEWGWRSLWIGVRERPACVNAHSLFVLPIAVTIKLFTRCRVVYDTHELETERSTMPALARPILRIFERTGIAVSDATIVVGDVIGEWYRKHYPRAQIDVIRNVPRAATATAPSVPSLRALYGLAEHELLFLYVGMLTAGRAIEKLIDVFRRLPADRHIVFMGFGPLVPLVNQAEASNIHFHAAVPPHEVCAWARSADVGVCVIEANSLSYYYSVPNKMYESLTAGIPVLLSNFPEMKRIIEQWNCGWLVEPSADAIYQTVASIDLAAIRARQPGAARAGQQLTWENEEPRLLDIYRRLAFGRHASLATTEVCPTQHGNEPGRYNHP
jgi:glycosyltransferase involved in cell wall biosynthesis